MPEGASRRSRQIRRYQTFGMRFGEGKTAFEAPRLRLIATSTVRLGWAATLGVFHEVKPDEATCIVRDKHLETKLAPPMKNRDPETAVYEF